MINPDILKKIPPKTGVYLFKDKSGNVLYIGKAVNLRKRIKNYFDKIHHENRINYLIKVTKKIDFFKVNSEIEALLLEAKLIKQYQPRYNIRLKDDKRYLYVGISKESYPRVFLIRAPEKIKENLNWFGPFPSSQSIREILRLLRRIFPYRSCQKMPKKVCLYFHLNLCPGMCQYPVGLKEYSKTIKKIKMFLEGDIYLLIRRLEKEMKIKAKDLFFEEAEKIHKKIIMIENLLGKFKRMPEEEEIKKALKWLRKVLVKFQKIEPLVIQRLEAYDIANLGKNIVVGSMVVFINGEPDVKEYRHFKTKLSFRGDPSALKEIIQRRLLHREWLYPQLILVDGGKTQVSAAFDVLVKMGLANQIALLGLTKENETIVIPVIEEKTIKEWKMIKRSSKSSGLFLLQFARDEAHRFAQSYYKKIHRKIIFSSGSFEQGQK